MYDARDSEILTRKLADLIEAKREAKENEFSANLFTRGINVSHLNNHNGFASLNNFVGSK